MTTYVRSITIPTEVFQNPAASILLPIVLGTAVGFGTRPILVATASASETQNMYMAMKQPPLRPPPWIFGPVWTVLYGLMGYAAYRAASIGLSPLASPKTVETTKHAMTVYSIQLAVNLVWMPLFFGLKRPVEATADIVVLLGLNGYLTYLWSSIDQVAWLCQIPYLGWLSFATYLCAGAGYLNDWDLTGKTAKTTEAVKRK